MTFQALVELGVTVAGVYLGLGLVFALVFVTRGVDRIDPVAADGTRGFRILILPGATLLWPLLLRRWAGGTREPRSETNAHRRAARRSPEGSEA